MICWKLPEMVTGVAHIQRKRAELQEVKPILNI